MYPVRRLPLLLALTISSFGAVPVLEELPKPTGSLSCPRQEASASEATRTQLAGQSLPCFFLTGVSDFARFTVPLPDKSPLPLPPNRSDSSEPDTLIAWRLQHIVYIGVFVVASGIILVIGMLNQRIEHAIVFALILSAILIAILWHL